MCRPKPYPAWPASLPRIQRSRVTLATIDAAAKTRDAGYKRWDTHTPFPVHGLCEAMGMRDTRLPWVVLGAGIVGAAGGLALQYFTNAVDYPFVISGKPIFSLPANIPIVFESAVLLAALTAFKGMLVANRLPCLHRPIFKSERFRRVTQDRFFIVIEADDRRFDPVKTRVFLESLRGLSVEEVVD